MVDRLKNAGWVVMGAIVLYWAVTTLVGTVWSGPLDPPAAPASTQRTQITSLPFTASVSGSYVVMADLTCTACNAGANGITVDVDDVTIDLNGFAIRGEPGSGDGIHVTASRTGVAVRNGIVSDWTINGVEFFNCTRCRVEDLEASNNGNHGIVIGASSTVSNVISAENTARGMRIWFDDNVISDALAYGNGSEGIRIEADDNVVRDSRVSDNGSIAGIRINGSGNAIRDLQAAGNTGDGIEIRSGANDNVFENIVARANTEHGIQINGDGNVVSDALVSGNGTDGIRIEGDDNVVRDSRVSDNGTDGIRLELVNSRGNVVENNLATGNTNSGIYVSKYNTIEGNEVYSNGGSGIYVGGFGNSIDGNLGGLNGGAADIEIAECCNWVVRNKSISAFIIAAGNTAGPIETSATPLTNPWANISH